MVQTSLSRENSTPGGDPRLNGGLASLTERRVPRRRVEPFDSASVAQPVCSVSYLIRNAKNSREHDPFHPRLLKGRPALGDERQRLNSFRPGRNPTNSHRDLR